MNFRFPLPAVVSLTSVAVMSLALTGCGSESKPKAVPTNCPTVKAGSVSDAVKVGGDFGQEATVKLDKAVTATDIQRSVPINGKGDVPADGASVNARLTLFNASGKKLMSQDAQVPLGKTLRPFFADALKCMPYGSRTVTTGPASLIYGDAGLPQGLKGTDTLILVSDVISAFAPVEWKQQVPTVTFDSQGKPTLKLDGKPISDWAVKILKQGTGEVVQAGDKVTLNYQGTSWDTGKIFDQSYGKSPTSFSTTQVITGFGGALVGQKIGTRLVVTIPPKYGYGTDKTQNLGGQTLVFVIEIIKTARS